MEIAKIRKAVIPAAGFGTRFLPMTKASPKEMLPVIDKPVIQYIVEEAVEAGIEEIIIITGSNKRAIEDHFDYNFELEYTLKKNNKEQQYKEIRAISDMAKFIYIRQREALGNGHAVLCAREVVNHEPFVVLWGDEMIFTRPNRVKQLIDTYQKYQSTVLTGLPSTKREDRAKYAFIKGQEIERNLYQVEKIVEKPKNGTELNDIAVVGGYLFPPIIFDYLEALRPSQGGEIWLSDAIEAYLKDHPVYTRVLEDFAYYDCGSKAGYLRANIELASQRDDLKDTLKEILKSVKL